jgi:hypothetical protein
MEEAAVNEDGELALGESDVGSASWGGVVKSPSTYPCGPERPTEVAFRDGVLASNAPHYVGALLD